MKYYLKHILICICCTMPIIVVGSLFNKSHSSEGVYMENEQVQFSKEQSERSSVISLSDGWRFTPGQLIAPDKITDQASQAIQMPYIIKNANKGTFSVKIRVPEANRIYSLRFVSSSNKQAVWVNNELVDQFNISRNTDTIVFYAKETDLDIVIHSESTGNNISVVETPSFGTMKQMKNLKYIDFGFNLFIVTIFFIFGLYSLLIHIWRRSDPFFLYGGVYFILISISTLFAGEKIGMQLFPFLSDAISFKIKTVVGLSSLTPLVYLIRHLKFADIPKRISQLFSVLCLTATVIMSLLPMNIYLRVEDYVWILITFVLIIILILLFNAICREKNHSTELFYAFIAFLHFAIYLVLLVRKNLNGSNSFYEMWIFLFMIYIFIFLSIRTANLQKEIESIKYEAIQSKISFLTVQIKPHFIYNSIANIIALCYTEPKEAAKLLGRFSTYLRLIFENNGPNMYIQLQKELTLIEAYVEIEQVRFQNKINFTKHIDPNLKTVSIPSLSIQPFIENAIRHGLFHKADGGNVHLTIKKADQSIHVTIEDDGIGMTSDKLQSILQLNDAHSGIGIQNVIQRLTYMNHGKITIKSEPNKGTIVTIHFPLVEKDLEE